MHSTYGAYNYTHNHKTVMHIQMQALSIIYILSATTPLQIHEGKAGWPIWGNLFKIYKLSSSSSSAKNMSAAAILVLNRSIITTFPLLLKSFLSFCKCWANFALYCGEQSQTGAFGLVLRESHLWQGRTPWGGASGSEVYRWETCLSMDTKHSHSA